MHKHYLAIATLIGLLSGCGPPPPEIQKTERTTSYKDLGSNYDANISIVKVGKCQYVIWERGYGSDMEHYEACKYCESKARQQPPETTDE